MNGARLENADAPVVVVAVVLVLLLSTTTMMMVSKEPMRTTSAAISDAILVYRHYHSVAPFERCSLPPFAHNVQGVSESCCLLNFWLMMSIGV